ncbi:MAG: acetylserotonin O-methyltransferase, partial [Candidatus Dormibacteraeota bacterium]|nr:acetylserotonin O-methyltransferase [Candidatus Dormibacteraeota bacterium]
LLNGFRAYQMVVAACRLEIPDLVATGPRTADELAASTGTHAPLLNRMLRALTAWSFFKELPDGRFASTALSDTFRSDIPGLRNMAIMLSEEGYEAWGHLMYVLQTGKPAYQHVYGKSHFERLGEEPEMAAHFNAAMVELSTATAQAFIAAYDLTGVRTVVDVGGGNGALLLAVLKSQPQIRGILFDLAQGLAGAHKGLIAAGVADRVTLQEGSFFEVLPPGGDLYLLKSIIHDWDDERALAILQTCRRAMGGQARLVVLERKLPERIDNPDDSLLTLMGDVHIMVVLGGKERTTNEYRELLAQAGLRMTREIPTSSGFAAIEAAVGG